MNKQERTTATYRHRALKLNGMSMEKKKGLIKIQKKKERKGMIFISFQSSLESKTDFYGDGRRRGQDSSAHGPRENAIGRC